MFLSIIVPVYNAEQYLAECLQSLLEQDIPKEDYEILCVNDGSKDNSLNILREFEGKYANIVVIDKENGGVVTARNTGLDAARGEYIWFVDSDDFLKANIMGTLRNIVLETNCDRLTVGGYLFTDALTEAEQALSQQKKLPINVPWYDAVVWRNLFRRSFLQEHDLCFHYPDLTHGEDGLFMYEVTLFSPKSAGIEEAVYFYREHSGSAETASSLENRRKKLRSYIRITKILQGYYQSGKMDAGTVNKLMSFLWFSLYEIAKLPLRESRKALCELKQADLFPYQRPPQCTLTRSYMTSRTDFLGQAMDKVYLNLHTRWGFSIFWAIQQLIGIRQKLRTKFCR